MSTAVGSFSYLTPPVNWFRVLTDLERAGLTNARVAAILGVSESTVNRWKQGTQPRYQDGASLLALHARHVDEYEIPKMQVASM